MAGQARTVRALVFRQPEAVGAQEIVGVAFSGEAPIAAVEISLDAGKTWRAATLEGEGGVGRWQVFRFRFTQKVPARLSALVRATDKRGSKQPQNAIWNPGGYHWNGWHSVTWEVG